MNKKLDEIDFNEKDLDEKIKNGDIDPVHMPEFISFSEIEKYHFCSAIIKYKKDKNFKQKDMAHLLGINKSEISRLFSYDLNEFSQERILIFIQRLLEHGATIDLSKVYDKISKQCLKLQRKLARTKKVVGG